MDHLVPSRLLTRASDWPALHRWERRQLALELRKLGLSYGEIRRVIPVPKSTLNTWFSGIRLSPEQVEAIRLRVGPESRRGIPVDTQRGRRQRIHEIRTEARLFAVDHLDDPLFIAGVVLYWGEGAKTRNHLDLTNSDPAALRLFIRWCKAYLPAEPDIQLSLHLHEGNDEEGAKTYWRSALGVPEVQFGKTFIKPRGTGHRKNHLEHGVCRVRTRRAADNWNRVMEWIDVVASDLGRYE